MLLTFGITQAFVALLCAFKVRHLPLLRRLDHRRDRLRRRLPAGDKGRAHRGDDDALEEALVLEEGHAGGAAGGRMGSSSGWRRTCQHRSQVKDA
jgi:hypothetical protein